MGAVPDPGRDVVDLLARLAAELVEHGPNAAGTAVADVERGVADLLDRCRAADPALVAEARTPLHRPALETDPDAAVVRALSGAHDEVRGGPAAVTGLSHWAGAAFLASRGIPTVLFGPGGEGAHTDVEWVSLADTVDCTRILVATARRLFTSP